MKKIFYKSPTILSCVGCIGVVITSVYASKATLKADKLLKDAENSKGEKLTKLETAKIVVHTYAVPVIFGVSTIACVLGSNVLNKKNQATLMSMYALADNSFKEYRKKLIELHGKEIDDEVMDSVIREHCEYHQIHSDTPDKKMRFYEPLSKRFIYAYEREIIDAEYHLNRNFVLRGYSPLNEFFEFLGINKTDYGDDVGWTSSYGYYWIDFEHHYARDEKGVYFVIDSMFPPDDGYLEC